MKAVGMFLVVVFLHKLARVRLVWLEPDGSPLKLEW